MYYMSIITLRYTMFFCPNLVIRCKQTHSPNGKTQSSTLDSKDVNGTSLLVWWGGIVTCITLLYSLHWNATVTSTDAIAK